LWRYFVIALEFKQQSKMKNLKRAAIAYLLFITVSVVFYQCCTDKHRIIGTSDIAITELGNTGGDTIRGAFFVDLNMAWEVAMEAQSFSLIQSAWALSCELNFVNPIASSSVHLSSSRPFTFDGQNVAAGDNILLLSESPRVDIFDGFISILLSDEFLSKADFETGEHTFSISAETTDELMIGDSASVILDIE